LKVIETLSAAKVPAAKAQTHHSGKLISRAITEIEGDKNSKIFLLITIPLHPARPEPRSQFWFCE
jgi:hypothetical protein